MLCGCSVSFQVVGSWSDDSCKEPCQILHSYLYVFSLGSRELQACIRAPPGTRASHMETRSNQTAAILVHVTLSLLTWVLLWNSILWHRVYIHGSPRCTLSGPSAEQRETYTLGIQRPFPKQLSRRDHSLEGPSTQYLRTLVPKAMKGRGFGTRSLKCWVLGISGVLIPCKCGISKAVLWPRAISEMLSEFQGTGKNMHKTTTRFQKCPPGPQSMYKNGPKPL